MSGLPQNLPKFQGFSAPQQTVVPSELTSLKDHLSRFSSGFSLLIPTDRAAPSYQLLVLSFAILPAVFPFLLTDIFNLGVCALVSSFFDNSNLHYRTSSWSTPHSITSSAVASSVCGTVSPSAFAVLRLMTSSNLVGC